MERSMDDAAITVGSYDRTTEDLGNIVEFGHVNIAVPDHRLATAFYLSGLGLTRDPYLMTGHENMWINAGREQFHCPLGAPQVLRGVIGLVIPDAPVLLTRLERLAIDLTGSQFAVTPTQDGVVATCPWGNRIRCHAPDRARFGRIALGIPYVEFEVGPAASLAGIARFYEQVFGGLAGVAADARGAYAWVIVGDDKRLLFRESAAAPASYDGHHIQITVADFSGPHANLARRGLISEESNQHQYRFRDIVDANGRVLFTVEHEVRSMRHPLYARPLVNRSPVYIDQYSNVSGNAS